MIGRLPVGEFYGSKITAREVAGFRLTECRFTPGAQIPDHVHAQAHFCVVLAGQYVERYGSRVRYCMPRNVILHPEGEIHSGRISPGGARDLAVEVPPHRLAGIIQQMRIFEEPADFLGGRLARCGVRLYKEFRMRDTASQLAIEAGVLEMLVEAGRARTQKTAAAPPAWLRHVRDSLHDRFSENISLSSLAEIAGVHVGHVARTFRQHYGCSVGEYLRRHRIEAACEELSRSNRPLSAVAAAAGFYDQAHFTNVFKAHVGVTPGQFRTRSQTR
jgi:AraC family transcriptional regulator